MYRNKYTFNYDFIEGYANLLMLYVQDNLTTLLQSYSKKEKNTSNSINHTIKRTKYFKAIFKI